MPEFNVYGRASVRLVKTVTTQTNNPNTAMRKARQDIEGWFIDQNDGIDLADIKIVTAEEVS